MMARSRQRVRLEDGLKLSINKLIGRGGIQPGSKTRAIASWRRCASRECDHIVCNAGNAHQQGKVVNEYAARSAGTG
jgi:hypothetical protein